MDYNTQRLMKAFGLPFLGLFPSKRKTDVDQEAGKVHRQEEGSEPDAWSLNAGLATPDPPQPPRRLIFSPPKYWFQAFPF